MDGGRGVGGINVVVGVEIGIGEWIEGVGRRTAGRIDGWMDVLCCAVLCCAVLISVFMLGEIKIPSIYVSGPLANISHCPIVLYHTPMHIIGGPSPKLQGRRLNHLG